MDFNNLNTGDESLFPTDSPVQNELTSSLNDYLLSAQYIDSLDQKATAGEGFLDWATTEEADKTKKIKGLVRRKNDAGVSEEVEAEVPMFNTAGGLTEDGKERFSRAKEYLEVAASLPGGGVRRNPETREWEVNPALENILTQKREKQPDRFSDMGAYIQERQKITKEGESPSLTYKEYTDFANAEVKNGEAHLDPENKEMEKAFYAESAKRTFDPSSLGDEVMIGKVRDQYVMNPKNFNQIDKMEAAINGLDLSAADKKMMLIDYRSKVEENIGKTVNQFAAADAGVLGSIVSSPLRDEFMEAMKKPGASGYEFLKANKDRMDKDSYGVGSEIAATFRDAMMATGTGALWLASAGNYTSPAEAWGGLAEDTAGAYSNGKAFELFGVDINRRDLTELTGQIGSFVAMGGMGALAGKGLTKVGAAGASRYAVNEAGVLLSTVAKTEAAAAAGTRTLGEKTLAGLKSIGTDPEVWLGSLQASGTSFGKTFNQEMNLHGDREKALKAANIEATSDGLSAFIATSVMNRVAPGMGKAFGMGDGAVGGGFIQNLKNKALTRESMEAVQKTISDLGGDAGASLRTQFAKDLKGVMNTSAKQLGLKGVGVLGNMGAEAVEESSDEIISDVISSMLDDSKTWTEDVWGNIGTKWKEYVKAGILGAVGGAMGDASGTVMDAKGTFGKSEGYDIQKAAWDQLKTKVETFQSLDQYEFKGTASGAKNMAEYIAMPDDKVSVEQKSKALLALARGQSINADFVGAVTPTTAPIPSVAPEPTSATTTPPAAPSATNPIQEPPAAQGVAATPPPVGTLGDVLSSSSITAPTGKKWRADIAMVPTEGATPLKIANNVTITPMSVPSGEGRSLATYVAAKKETVNPDGTVTTEYLSPPQAATALRTVKQVIKPKDASMAKRWSDKFSTNANDTTYHDEWSEQDGANPTTDAEITVTGEEDLADVRDAEGNSGGEAASAGASLKTSSAGAVASSEGLSDNEIDLSPSEVSPVKEAPSATPQTPLNIGDAVPQLPNELKDGREYTKKRMAEGLTREQAAVELSKKRKSFEAQILEQASQAEEIIDEQGVVWWSIGDGKFATGGSHAPRTVLTIFGGKVTKLKTARKETNSPDAPTTGPTPSATPAEETKKPTPPTDENQSETDAKRKADADVEAKRQGLLNEGAAEESTPAAPATPTNNDREVVRNKLGSDIQRGLPPLGENDPNYIHDNGVFKPVAKNGKTYVTDEAIDNELSKGGGTRSVAIKSMQARLAGHSKADALKTQDKTADNAASTVYQDVVYVADPELIKGGDDSIGGNWTMDVSETKEVVYSYRPPTGSSLSLSIGEVVAIEGKPDEFLQVTNVVNGRWEFSKKTTAEAAGDLITDKGLINQGNKYTRSLLANVAKEVQKHFKSIAKGDITPENMEKLFAKVMKVVSPKKTFKVVKEEMSGDSFLYAEPNVDSTEYGTIKVDYAKMAVQLAKIYRTANTNDSASNTLLGMDAARVISAWIDEELTHLIGFKIFSADELRSFYKAILDLPKNKDGSDHEFTRLLKETLKERFPTGTNGRPLDASIDDADMDDSVGADAKELEITYTVATELIRKLHQMATKGTTTERDTALSRQLQDAIYGDAFDKANETQGSLSKSPLRVIGHMIRRYAERVRNILWMKWQTGTLPPQAREMLASMNRAYRNEGIQGDVDYGYDEATKEAERRRDVYEKAFKEEVGKIARLQSKTAMKLRSISRQFGHMNLSQSLVVDHETMTLDLHPRIKAHIAEYKTLTDEEMEQVEGFLFDLNDKGGKAPAYQQAMTVAFMKQQVMEMRRDSLSFNPLDLFDTIRDDNNPDLSPTQRKEANAAKRMLLWRTILDGMPAEESSTRPLTPLMEARGLAVDEMNRTANEAYAHAIRAVQDIDTKVSGSASIKELLKWGRLTSVGFRKNLKPGKYKVSTNLEIDDVARPVGNLKRPSKSTDQTNIALSPLVASVDQSVEWSPRERLERANPEEFAAALESYKTSILQSLLVSENYITGDLHERFAKTFSGPVVDSLARLKEQESKVAEMTEMIEKLRAYSQEKFDASQKKKEISHKRQDNVFERDENQDPEARAKAQAVYREYMEFQQAVDDYNDSIQFVKNRSVGEFWKSSEDFGINLADLNVPTGEAGSLEFKSLSDTLEHAYGSDDVFKGLMAGESVYSYGAKAVWPKAGKTLTQEQEDWNAGLEIYQQTMESNADFVGKNLFLNYWVSSQLGKLEIGTSASDYERTGGFLFNKEVNDNDQEEFESLDSAFPDFDGEEFGSAKHALSKSDKSGSILALLKAYQGINSWTAKIKSKYEGRITDTVGGEQSFAGRMTPMLQGLFGKLQETRNSLTGETSFEMTGGLDSYLQNEMRVVMNDLKQHYKTKSKYNVNGVFQMPSDKVDFMDFFELENGNLIKISTMKVADINNKLYNTIVSGQGSQFLPWGFRNATRGVKLLKKSLKAFQNDKWHRNVEYEGNRYQRDPAFEPDNKAFLKLKEMTSDARVVNRLAWTLKYFEEDRNYIYGSTWASELYDSINRSSYGEGRMPYVRVKPGSDGQLRSTDEVINPNDFSGSPDDPRVANSFMNASSPTMEGYNDTYNEGRASTPSESAERAFGRPAVNRAMSVTSAAMFIGSNGPNGRSSADGQQFHFDVMRAERHAGWFNAEQVIAERERREALNPTGMRSFGGMVTDPATGLDVPRISDNDIREMEDRMNEDLDFNEANPYDQKAVNRELFNAFNGAMTEELVKRGLKGLFPAVGHTNDEMHGQIYTAFLSEYGNKMSETNGYRFTDSERFIMDLLEFKMKFEREVVEADRFKNQDDVAVAYEAIKNGNPFVSPEESERITAAIKESMVSENFWFKDSRLGMGHGTGNAIIDHLVDNLAGRTIVAHIQSDVANRNGLQSLGVQIFKGKPADKKAKTPATPNVVILPLNQNGPYVSKDKARSVISQLLSISAENDPSVKTTLIELALKIDTELKPVAVVEGRVITRRSQPGKRTFVANKSQVLDALDRMAAIRADFDIVSRSLSFPDIEPATADAIITISAFLTDDKAKTFLDESFKTREDKLETTLPVQIQDDLMKAIWSIRQSKLDDPGRFGDETENSIYEVEEEPVDSEEDEMDEENASTSSPDAMIEIDDATERNDELSGLFDNTELDEFQREMNEIGEEENKARTVMSQADFSQNDRSDNLLYNALASIVLAGKQFNGVESDAFLDELRTRADGKGRSTNEILRDQGKRVYTDKNNKELQMLSSPVIKTNSKEDKSTGPAKELTRMQKVARIYVGSALTLTMPNANGRTRLTSGFYGTRIKRINAGLLYNTGSVEAMVEEQMTLSIKNALLAKAAENKTHNQPNDSMADMKFGHQELDVVVNDQLIADLKVALPRNAMEIAEREARALVKSHEDNKARFEEVLAGLKTTRAEAVVLNAENVRKYWAGTESALPDKNGKRNGKKLSVDVMSNAMSRENAELAKAESVVLAGKLRVLDRQIARVEKDLRAVNAELSKVENYTGGSYVGQSFFKGDIGVGRVTKGDVLVSEGVEPVSRTIGFHLFLTPEFTESKNADGTNTVGGDKTKWNDLSSDESMADAEIKARRKEHYIKETAVLNALTNLSKDHIDDNYKIARNTQDNFQNFNPLKVIRQAIKMTEVEEVVLRDNMGQARSDAEQAMMRGLEAEHVAMLVDPASAEFQLLTPNQQTRLTILNMPKSMKERSEKIGSLFSQEGQDVIMVATTAREQLMRSFPSRVTKRNSNTVLGHIASHALAIAADDHSYFMDTMDGIKGESFNSDEFSLTKGKTLTKDQAAKTFSNEFTRKMQVFLDGIRNDMKADGTKKVDMSRRVSQAALAGAIHKIEGIVMAYNDSAGVLSDDTKKAVKAFLESISENDGRSFTNIAAAKQWGAGWDVDNMIGFKTEEIFSKVFMEVETDLILQRLTTSMTIHNSKTSLFFMEYLDHHDARMKKRFQKTRAGRQAAIHLRTLLDRGIDGKSGRHGYERSKKVAQEEIAQAAKQVGHNAQDQSIGYFIALLDGLVNAHGLTYAKAFNEWIKQAKTGFAQYDEFAQAQDDYYGKNDISRYWNAGHLDLIRDRELTEKMRSILTSAKVNATFTDDVEARAEVEKIKATLRKNVSSGKEAAVDHYAKTIGDVLGDIDSAMHFTQAMLSKPESADDFATSSKWRDKKLNAYKTTYSSVPMSIAYAGNPAGKEDIRQGEYVSDPMDIVSFDEASFFGGIGHSSRLFDDKSVFRPISVNGLSAPQSLVDDAIYRLNVTPTYEVLRRSIGKVKDVSGQLNIEDSGMLAILEAQKPDPLLPNRELREAEHEHKQNIVAATTALAFVANELEVAIRNDFQTGAVNTGGSETLRFLSSAFIVRSLASVQQITDQSVGPSIGYTLGKLAVGKPGMVKNYFRLVAKYLTDSKFREKARQLVMDNDVMVYYRSLDGREVLRDVTRGQKRYGSKVVKNTLGKAIRTYEKVGEDALDFTIGKMERALATSVFIAELMDHTNVTDENELFKGNVSLQDMDIVNSRLKVNEMFGQSDHSNKAWMFQSRDHSPFVSALWKALTLFSNHTSSTASNMSVQFPQAINPLLRKAGFKKIEVIDEATHKEALENVVATFVQNALFPILKWKVAVSIVSWVIARVFMGDDEDEAVIHAQEMANNILAPSEDGNAVANFLKIVAVGKERELFRSDLEPDAAFASALAEIFNKTLLESATMIPVGGVAAGYSPVSNLLEKFITNDAAESIVTMVTNGYRGITGNDEMLEKSRFYFDDDGVMARQYEAGAFENAMGVTAATSAVYDMSSAMKLLAEYNMTDEAASNRMSSASNSAMYALTELAPFMRDARGHFKSVLRKPVKEEKRESY